MPKVRPENLHLACSVGSSSRAKNSLGMQGWMQMVADTEILPWRELQSMPCGKIWRLSFFSPALGLRRFVGVYRTQGPALPRFGPHIAFFFRGHFTEWFYPEEDPSRQKHCQDKNLTLVELVQEGVDKGDLPPCLLVFPDFGGDNRDGLTLAIDWKRSDLAEKANFVGGGLGAFETSFRQEFLPRFEEALGLINPKRLAIGFSLGGLNAVQMALRNPHLFSVVAAYDGSFPHYPVDPQDFILRHELFDPIFGRPADRAHLKAHAPAWLVRQLPFSQLQKMSFYLASGPEAAEPSDANYFRTKAVVDALAERGIANSMPMVIEEGHHDWYTADRFALQVLASTIGTNKPDK